MAQRQSRDIGQQIQRAVRRSEFYAILRRWGWTCGSMDGGCVLVALALHEVLGGELYSVYHVGLRKLWQHAVIFYDGRFLDGDYSLNLQEYVEAWRKRYDVHGIAVEPCTEEFLVALTDQNEGPAYCADARGQMANYFRKVLEIV